VRKSRVSARVPVRRQPHQRPSNNASPRAIYNAAHGSLLWGACGKPQPNGWSHYVAGKEAPPQARGGTSARQAEHLPGSIRVAATPVRVTDEMMRM
jgi:hypothetical protein